MNNTFCICSPSEWQLCIFHCLVVRNEFSINDCIEFPVWKCLHFFGIHTPKCNVLSYDEFIFSFKLNHVNYFQTGYTTLHSQEKCVCDQVSAYSQAFVVSTAFHFSLFDRYIVMISYYVFYNFLLLFPQYKFFFYRTAWWPSYIYTYTIFFLPLSCSIISD